MNKIIFMLTGIIMSVINITYAQKAKTDANIVGHVTNNGSHLPYANISMKGTTIGTLTDETGHFQLVNCLREVTSYRQAAWATKHRKNR